VTGRALTDEYLGVVVALVQAYRLGDEAAFNALVDGLDQPRALLAFAVSVVDELGTSAAGGDRWSAMLAAWRPGRRLGEPVE
jgi:hypothetical protein